jgi:hypothetical protein
MEFRVAVLPSESLRKLLGEALKAFEGFHKFKTAFFQFFSEMALVFAKKKSESEQDFENFNFRIIY